MAVCDIFRRKKFNLDGPDGWRSYWHDIRKEPREFFSRQMGGGSCMVWAGFSWNGKTDIAFMNGKQNTQKYLEILESNLIPSKDRLGGENFIFQQDNARIHTSKEAENWFKEKRIQIFDWPSRSPDLNPMENLWGILARKVYSNGRQFQTVGELKKAIIYHWNEIENEVLENLISSMPERVFNVIQRGGYSI